MLQRGIGAGMGVRARVVAACIMGLMVSPALATGFFLNQQSVQGLGRTDAGNAVAAGDPSTVYSNPAGLPYLWRDSATQGSNTLFAFSTHLIIPTSDHVNTGSTATTPGSGGAAVRYAGVNFSDPTEPTPVPNMFIAHKLAGDNAYVGLAITSPFGLSAKYSDDWFGRYDATEVSLRTVNFAMVGAYQFTPALSVGGGLDVQYARSKLVQAVPNPLNAGGPTAATDARAESTGTAWTPGFNIGAMYQADDATRFGLHYRSAMHHKITGTVTTTGLTGALAAGNGVVGATSQLNLPQIVTAGVMRRIGDKLTVYGEIDWYGWSIVKELRVQFDNGTADAVRPANYRNTFAYAVGADYAWSERLTVRGGVQFDFTPTVDATRDTTFPDSDRIVFATGASYRFNRRTYFDFAAGHVKFRTAGIGITRSFFTGTAVASTATISDSVTPSVTTVSAQVRYAF